jgi:hypothetical protein
MSPPEGTIPFQQLVERLLDTAVADGIKPPITFVLVSVDGYVSAVRYERTHDGSWNRNLLVESAQPKGKFPVNLIFCDVSGRSLCARMDSPNARPTMGD